MAADPYRPVTTSTRLSLPLNGTVYTTRRRVAGEKPLPVVGSTMEAELGSAFAASVVIDAGEIPTSDGSGKEQTLVHAIIPAEADQLATNWEWATCDIGGRKFDGITRTVIIPKASFDPATPALGSAMPISSGTTGSDYQFTSLGFILVNRNAARSGMQLEPVFRVEVREYVRKVAMVNMGIDSINGKPLRETVTLYHANEKVPGSGVVGPPDTRLTAATLFAEANANHAFWGIQSNGYENSGQQLTAQWYAITSSQVIAGTAAVVGNVTVISVSSSPSNDEYYWPPVLQHIEFMDWAKREGGEDIYPRVAFKHEEFRGPCKTLTTRSWCSVPFEIAVVEQLQPNGGHYASPFFSLSLPNCLHGLIPVECDIGSADPTYLQNTGSRRFFLPTNKVDWPSYITAYDDQEPYRGGYLRTTKVVYAPAGSGGGAPAVFVPVPTGLVASNIVATGFDITWNSDAEASSYIVEVATDALFTAHVWYSEVTEATATITGLTTGTLYYSRVTAIRPGYMVSQPCAAISTTTA